MDIAVLAQVLSSLATFVVAAGILYQGRETRKARNAEDRPQIIQRRSKRLNRYAVAGVLEEAGALFRPVDRLEDATCVSLCLLHPRQGGVGDSQRTSRSYPFS